MASHPLKSVVTDNIQAATKEFFSQGTLGEKLRQAETLIEMPGHQLFQTGLPWQINTDDGSTEGFSEGLIYAVKDIQAQLVALEKKYPLETKLSLSIDEARLPARPKQRAALRTVENS